MCFARVASGAQHKGYWLKKVDLASFDATSRVRCFRCVCRSPFAALQASLLCKPNVHRFPQVESRCWPSTHEPSQALTSSTCYNRSIVREEINIRAAHLRSAVARSSR